LPEPPDLVVGGINHGPNLGNDVLYSGTVSVAMEGALFGRGAIAVSLCLPDSVRGRTLEAVDFAVAAEFVAKLADAVVAEPMPPGVLLNVNVPYLERAGVRGHKLCRLGYTDWADAVTERHDPRGRPYYWIAGQRNGTDAIGDSDNAAVDDGYISVTPIHYDVTDYRSFTYARHLALAGFDRARDALGDVTLPHPVHPKARRRS
ncbi:MAG: 5'/3'-nucleotidase SurE, partial [Myxococcota bacterium]